MDGMVCRSIERIENFQRKTRTQPTRNNKPTRKTTI